MLLSQPFVFRINCLENLWKPKCQILLGQERNLKMSRNVNEGKNNSRLSPRLSNAVYKVFEIDGLINIKGWLKLNDAERAGVTLVLKRRKSSAYYLIPYQWLDNSTWEVNFDVNQYHINKGTWDLYFQYDNKKYRVKLENETTIPENEYVLYKCESQSRYLSVYKTVKGSLSFKSTLATIEMNELRITMKNKDSVMLNGMTENKLPIAIKENLATKFVLKQRSSHEKLEYPIMLQPTRDYLAFQFSFEFNYKGLMNENKLFDQIWECSIYLPINGENHLFRIFFSKPNLLEQDSKIEFEHPRVYQIYFYTTVNNNLSIRLNEVKIQRDLETYRFDKNFLRLKGYAYLDTIDPGTIKEMKHYIVVRKKGSDNEIRLELSEAVDDTENENQMQAGFDIEVPLSRIIKLEDNSNGIYDLFIQIHYLNEIYERRLGCEEYLFYKDGIIDKATLRDKMTFVTQYLTFTPRGNLKIETFTLSGFGYIYFKYGRKIDRMFNRKKDIWLIGERPDTAQDTGYHFFKYCRENHPHLDVYYVIDSNSKDIKNIREFGNILFTGTFKHMRMASLASTFIGSHEPDYILPLKGCELDNYVEGKRVFLQHGVLGRKSVEYHKNYYKYPFQLFCVSSEAEKQMVVSKMNYEKKDVKVTGLSRFDNLLEQKSDNRTVLFIPTWREWLNTDRKFKGSMYFKRYQSLLENPMLHKLLEKYDVNINFYPHYRMQPFINEFKKLKTNRVKVIELGERNVQDLLIENQLMITDYSSVSFDFNYMSKPVIFYHFDSASFFKNGILRPKEETFLGDICRTEDQVIESIEYYFKNNFQERDEVKNKKGLIFSKVDRNNCKRIFEEINNLEV